jgi:thymidylate kinase
MTHAEAIKFDSQEKVLAALSLILRRLEECGFPYAAPCLNLNSKHLENGDFDIVTGRHPNRGLLQVLRELESAGHFSLINILHYDTPSGFYYVLRCGGTGTQFLHLDCLYDQYGINRYLLASATLLQGREHVGWGYRLGPKARFAYLLMKRITKRRLTTTSLAELQSAALAGGDAAWSMVESVIGKSATQQCQTLCRAASPNEANSAAVAAQRAAKRYRRQYRGLLLVGRWAGDLCRKTRRFFRPTGFFVVLVGPDGCGKSTVAGLLQQRLARSFRRTWRFHWRPGLLPRLGRKPVVGTAPPPAEARTGRTVSILRFLYYLADFIMGHWLVIYPRKAQTTLIVGERYFADVVVNPGRYGFRLPAWILRAASAFVPAPDLIVALEDDPKAIVRRKAEIPVEEVSRQILKFRAELRRWKTSAIIDGSEGAHRVADQIAEMILRQCARRTYKIERGK